MSESHIAAQPVEIGPHLRQRCAWCGTVLLDYDLRKLAYLTVTPPEERKPSTWPAGEIIRRNGHLSETVEHKQGDPVPADCCATIDPAATT